MNLRSRVSVVKQALSDIEISKFTKAETEDLKLLKKRRDLFLSSLPDKSVVRKLYPEGDRFRFGPKFPGEKPLREEKIKLKEVAYRMSTKDKYDDLLYLLAVRLKSKKILELGTGFGISSLYLLQALDKYKNSQFDTVEKWCLPFNYYKEIFKYYSWDNYNIIHDNIDNVLPALLAKSSYDLVFHDARHWKDMLKQDLKVIFKFIPSGALVIIDDINWSSEMEKAWEDIIKTKEVYFSYLFKINSRPGKGLIIKA